MSYPSDFVTTATQCEMGLSDLNWDFFDVAVLAFNLHFYLCSGVLKLCHRRIFQFQVFLCIPLLIRNLAGEYLQERWRQHIHTEAICLAFVKVWNFRVQWTCFCCRSSFKIRTHNRSSREGEPPYYMKNYINQSIAWLQKRLTGLSKLNNDSLNLRREVRSAIMLFNQ